MHMAATDHVLASDISDNTNKIYGMMDIVGLVEGIRKG